MTETSIWWVLTGALVALELASGTFYLLMLALGAAVGAVSAHLGLALKLQLTAAAVVGMLAVSAAYAVRRRRPDDPSPRADRSVNLDIGSELDIDRWQDDGTASVRYRGAQWTAVYRGPDGPRPGRHRVVELEGARLLVEPL